MREIIPQRLWIGTAIDLRDVNQLLLLDVAAVVDLAVEEPLPKMIPRDLVYVRFPLMDGDDNLQSTLQVAIETVASLIRSKVPTLVACSAGMSRSPAIVATALGAVERESPVSMLQRIAQDGPLDVSPRLWAAVQDVYQGIVGAKHERAT